MPINTITYNSIIDVAVRTNDLDKAEELYQELEAAKLANLAEIAEIERTNGLPLSGGEGGQAQHQQGNSHYHGHGHNDASQYEAETKRAAAIKQKSDELRAQGKSEEEIEAAGKESEERLKQAESEIVKLKSNANLSPDLITYSTLVKGFCHHGNMDRAIYYMDLLKSRGHLQPDELIYNSLLDGCVKASDLATGTRVFDEMREEAKRGSLPAPGYVTYQILHRLYRKVGYTEADATNEITQIYYSSGFSFHDSKKSRYGGYGKSGGYGDKGGKYGGSGGYGQGHSGGMGHF